ncbi:MAG: hypothetical protein HY540_03925 [Deltaproteobacteria bacterium]|nr:hypothetical protein [Deltaproteobacteria bacterium]
MKKSRHLLTGLCVLLFAGCAGDGTSSLSPQANAGEDQNVLIGETVTLDGLGSVAASNVRWAIQSKPTGSSASLAQATSLQSTFVPDVSGTYVIKLSLGAGSSSDTVSVTAKSVAAVIKADATSSIRTRERFNTTEYVVGLEQSGGTLSGSSSRVTSGQTIASYAWEQVSGPSATTTNGTTNSSLTFTAPSLVNFLNDVDRFKWQLLPVSREDTKMVFTLTVTSSNGDTSTSSFIVYIDANETEIATSSGLPSVSLNTKVYLSGPNLKAPSTAITDWTWTLSSRPSGSSATFADTGSTTSALEFPSFTPDVAGLYGIAYSTTSGATSGTISMVAAKWVGVGTIGGTTPEAGQCGLCHDGGIQSDVLTPWQSTKHATVFRDSLNTYAGLAPTPYLWPFHTVGYDSNASNDGFDELASLEGFGFPSTGLSYDEFTGAYPDTAKLANVQCENCHGPGSQHTADPLRIKYSISNAGVCGQCHTQEAEWVNSSHNSTGVAHGSSYQSTWLGANCARCHAAAGFKKNAAGQAVTAVSGSDAFVGITCAACHNPHDATNADQLRLKGNITMVADGSTVDAGKAAVCYSCHDAFYTYNVTNSCDSDSNGVGETACATIDQAATQSLRQVHYNPQAPVLEGKGALTDLNGNGTADFTLTENSFHSGSTFTLAGVTGDSTLASENNKCVTCHMASGPAIDEEGFRHLGGHAFKLRSEHGIGHLQGEETEDDSEASAGTIQLTSACTTCHASVTDFNRLARNDYDGDGNQEGIQDELKGLLLALSNKIKTVDASNIKSTSGTTSSNGTITVDTLSYAGTCSNFTGTCKAAAGTSTCSNVATGKTRDDYQQCNFMDATTTVRRAIWNHNLIARDGSLGVHNAAFAIQVLQKTYTAVGGTTFTADFPLATLR